MSRAGAKASQERRKLDRIVAEMAKLEENARADTMLVACENCGQQQVEGTRIAVLTEDLESYATYPDRSCVICGHNVCRYVLALP